MIVAILAVAITRLRVCRGFLDGGVLAIAFRSLCFVSVSVIVVLVVFPLLSLPLSDGVGVVFLDVFLVVRVIVA